MTLRIVAGESGIGSRRDSVRLPTGPPVSTYCSTISRNTAALRLSSPGGTAGRWGTYGASIRGGSGGNGQAWVTQAALRWPVSTRAASARNVSVM